MLSSMLIESQQLSAFFMHLGQRMCSIEIDIIKAASSNLVQGFYDQIQLLERYISYPVITAINE